jgi:hypothetical protein
MNQNDVGNLADAVAKAIFETTGDDVIWGQLDESDRDDFRMAAHAAMKAHVDWLTLNGWTMIKMEKRPRKERIISDKPKLIGLH